MPTTEQDPLLMNIQKHRSLTNHYQGREDLGIPSSTSYLITIDEEELWELIQLDRVEQRKKELMATCYPYSEEIWNRIEVLESLKNQLAGVKDDHGI